ncbi:MAG TPA: GH36 C-terminal domain-containing protein, partial [Chthoniobacterales bacterium]
DLYRLETAAEAGFSIWQTVLPDGSRSVYSFVSLGQLQGIHHAAPRLRGLVPGAVYAVSDDLEKELGRYPGWQLMSLGLPGDDAFGGMGRAIRSRTLLLEKVA